MNSIFFFKKKPCLLISDYSPCFLSLIPANLTKHQSRCEKKASYILLTLVHVVMSRFIFDWEDVAPSAKTIQLLVITQLEPSRAVSGGLMELFRHLIFKYYVICDPYKIEIPNYLVGMN